MPRIRYRVVDLRNKIIDPNEVIIECTGLPEKAAKDALGIDLVRSGNRADLAARVIGSILGPQRTWSDSTPRR